MEHLETEHKSPKIDSNLNRRNKDHKKVAHAQFCVSIYILDEKIKITQQKKNNIIDQKIPGLQRDSKNLRKKNYKN